MISKFKDFVFAVKHGLKGFPVSIGDNTYRIDESLRRWNFEQEEEVRVCLEQNLAAGDTAIDVGANFGMHTIIMANSVGTAGSVIAYEPIPFNLDLLRRNVSLNGYDSIVKIQAAALSDLDTDLIDMSVDSQGVDPAASLTNDSSFGGSADKISVANRTIDQDPKSLEPNAGCLIKIDVEGAELSVLRSGAEFLKRVKPKLLIEVHDYALPNFGESTESVYTFLKDLGYEIEALSDMNNHNGHYHHILATAE